MNNADDNQIARAWALVFSWLWAIPGQSCAARAVGVHGTWGPERLPVRPAPYLPPVPSLTDQGYV